MAKNELTQTVNIKPMIDITFDVTRNKGYN